MKNTAIEWCDHTFNPWSGCTKVSAGCQNCYAETLASRFPTLGRWGKGAKRVRTSEKYWRQPLAWDKTKIVTCRYDHNGDGDCHIHPNGCPTSRPRVFCASMADWLDDEVPIEWLADLLDLIRKTPNLDWILLTKRPKNWQNRMLGVIRQQLAGNGIMIGDAFQIASQRSDKPIAQIAGKWVLGNPPANVWIGTSVENQATADERIPLLLDIPARVRFLSCEPLLEQVDLRFPCVGTHRGTGSPDCPKTPHHHHDYNCVGRNIHWVIAGGESGPHARPMHPEWARSLRDQCAAAGVPFFFKQWGEWAQLKDWPMGNSPHVGPMDLNGLGYNDIIVVDVKMRKFGKKAAGNTLDGKQHLAFPAI